MFCRKCGAQIADDSDFCAGCGAKTAEPIMQQQPTAITAPNPTAYTIYAPPGVQPIPTPQIKFMLLPNENIFATHFGVRMAGVAANGNLYITNMRFIWTKKLTAASIVGGGLLAVGISAGQKDLYEIPLENIVAVSDKRVRSNKGGISITTLDNQTHNFAVATKMGFFNDEAKAARNIMLTVLQFCANQNNSNK